MIHSKAFGSLVSLFLVLCLAIGVLSGCSQAPAKSRIEKRVCIYLNRMEGSAVDLALVFNEITGARRLNTKERLKEASQRLEAAIKSLHRADRDIDAYIGFINDNQGALKAGNLEHYITVTKLFNRTLTHKRAAMGHYFSSMDTWLTYAAAHYDRLKAGDVQSKRSYDSLFLDLDRSLKDYERANTAYLTYVHDFFLQYPDLKDRFSQRYKLMKKKLGWF